MNNKYLVKVAQIEKEAFLAEAAAYHIGLNALMKKALPTKMVSKHISEGFATGLAGVKPTSVMSRAREVVVGSVLPEIATMRYKAHEAGIAMRKKFPIMDNRTKAGLHILSNGDIPRLQRMGLHDHPAVQHAAREFDKHFGSDMHGALSDKVKGEKVHALFQDGRHPLLSNVVRHLPEGKVPAKVKVGKESINHGIAGAALTTAVDPSAGVSSLAKTLIAHPRVQNNKYAKKVADGMEHMLLVKPVKKGFAEGTPTTKWGRIKAKMHELLVNPVAAQAKHTAGAFKDIERGN